MRSYYHFYMLFKVLFCYITFLIIIIIIIIIEYYYLSLSSIQLGFFKEPQTALTPDSGMVVQSRLSSLR